MKNNSRIIRIARSLRPAFSALFLVVTSLACFAHPMGNFSISHYSAIGVQKNHVEIRYIIDMAEIPTFQEMQQNSLVANAEDRSVRNYLPRQAEALKSALVLTLSGRPLELRTESSEILFPPGAGGLPTLKMAFIYRADFASAQISANINGSVLYYRDNNFPNRIGWKEVIATPGRGVKMVTSSAPEKDRSAQLSNYPTDLLNSAPSDVEASVNFALDQRSWLGGSTSAMSRARRALQSAASRPRSTGPQNYAGASASDRNSALPIPHATRSLTTPAAQSLLEPNKQGTPQNRFTQLMTANQFGIWFLAVAAAMAAGLGALHALEPGHGKTIVAAYLVGSTGTAYHAFLLGLIVTASHTAGVYALGAVTLYASRYIVPEQLYPWLGAISGMLIAALGSYLFLQRYAGHAIGHSHGPGGHHHHHGPAHSHRPADGYVHTHDGYEHSHAHGHHPQHETRRDVSFRQLLALGITGGIVPCPAALVVLLSAVALNRVGFGLFLIVAFSFGLAAVLIAVGMLMVYARQFMIKFRSEGPLITRWLPLTSAAVITFLGLAITVRSLVTGGILQIRV
jgi:ABC-type nickel/cobalt efflux system permease component RcnA